MLEKSPSARRTLQKNLVAAIRQSKLSEAEVARRAKIDPKTVNNMVHARNDPQLGQVEAVAHVFGLPAWMLLSNVDVPTIVNNNEITRLVELYAQSNEKGRQSIMHVAEMAAASSRGVA